jgi:chromatin assembly factor 1 subunit B
MFMDETVPSFFRRPCWTPDGSLLVVPTGSYRAAVGGAVLPTTYLFSRACMSAPLGHLPGTAHTKASVVARASPALFKLRPAGDTSTTSNTNSAFSLPYRMYIAVATLDSVFVYDTQHATPVAVISGFHCDKITDIAW